MQNTMNPGDPHHLPVRGQLYQDLRGRYLRVEEVIHSNVLDGFFIVRLSIGATEECKDDSWVLGRSEFAALCRERGLHLAGSSESSANIVDIDSARDGRRRA
jgi:hypothetical protein